MLGSELSALVGESYERAYGDMVRVQQLTELEEVIRYQQSFAGKEPSASVLHLDLLLLLNLMNPSASDTSLIVSVYCISYLGTGDLIRTGKICSHGNCPV